MATLESNSSVPLQSVKTEPDVAASAVLRVGSVVEEPASTLPVDMGFAVVAVVVEVVVTVAVLAMVAVKVAVATVVVVVAVVAIAVVVVVVAVVAIAAVVVVVAVVVIAVVVVVGAG